MTSSVFDRYSAYASREGWSFDPEQAAVAQRLDAVADALAAPDETSSPMSWLFGGLRKSEPPRGLYIHGAVGRGKTMLMDLFFAEARVERKRRVHFHAFMSDVHARIHIWRQAKKRHAVKGDDPIAPVAADLADAARLLCFDEFAVTDIADAMILGRLFAALFAHGVTIVATSNVAPRDLYAEGLNRALFLPSIDLIERHMEVVRLDAAQDFRLTKLFARGHLVRAGRCRSFSRPRRPLSVADRRTRWPADRPRAARPVHTRAARRGRGLARFAFADLCEAPLGAVDFLTIAQTFHTVLVDGIRVIAPGERNVAKRLITLIDTLYDAQVKLIASAAAQPADLYQADGGHERFEFARTVSRLIEMRSDAYLAQPHRAASAGRAGDPGGLVET